MAKWRKCADIKAAAMAHYPQNVAKINSQVVHKSYPEPVDRPCGQTGGEPVENQGMTGGQPGKTLLASTHTPRPSTLSAHPLCTKMGCELGKTRFSPESTAPITTTFL